MGTAAKKLSLQEVVEGIEDTRRRRSVWYPLHKILFIMLTAKLKPHNPAFLKMGWSVRF